VVPTHAHGACDDEAASLSESLQRARAGAPSRLDAGVEHTYAELGVAVLNLRAALRGEWPAPRTTEHVHTWATIHPMGARAFEVCRCGLKRDLVQHTR
jgi:hypothetical protein